MIKKPTCFETSNARCIDLNLTNKEFLKNSGITEVGVSEHQSFIVTALKSQLQQKIAKTKPSGLYFRYNLGIFKEDPDNSFKNNLITVPGGPKKKRP